MRLRWALLRPGEAGSASGEREGWVFLEIAQIDVKDGMEEAFETGVGQAEPLFRRAKGCRGFELQRSVENPSRYRLFVRWDTIENHTRDFRESSDFQEWRALVGHCFASPPAVEHTRVVVPGFSP